jgi:hypothetical protein
MRDVGGAEPTDCTSFAVESRDDGRIARELGSEHLDRDAPATSAASSFEDDSHAALAEGAHDLVGAT